jgi:hypothetical protein
MSIDLSLPTFALDCRDWLVATEADGILPDDIDGVAVLAVLSTAVVDQGDLQSASAVFSLGLLDDEPDEFSQIVGLDHTLPAETDPAATDLTNTDRLADEPDVYVHDADWAAGHARFVVPSPDGSLAVIAEFSSAPMPSPDLVERFHRLVDSFRWTF